VTARDRIDEIAGNDLRLRRMQSEFERRRDAEVAAAATGAPEQVRTLPLACPSHFPIRADDLDRREVVDRHAVTTRESSEAAAERQAADPGMGHGAHWRHQSMRQGRLIDLTEQRAACRPHTLRIRIHAHGAEFRQIDQHAALARRLPGGAVTAALHRDQQVVRPSEPHCRLNIGHTGHHRDQCRMLVERGVQDATRSVVAGVAGEQQVALQLCRELRDGGAAQRDLATVSCDTSDIGDRARPRECIRTANARKRERRYE
jgi:hypothetical protein